MREPHDNDTTEKHPLMCVHAPLETKLSILQRAPREINNLAKLSANDERMRANANTKTNAAQRGRDWNQCG